MDNFTCETRNTGTRGLSISLTETRRLIGRSQTIVTQTRSMSDTTKMQPRCDTIHATKTDVALDKRQEDMQVATVVAISTASQRDENKFSSVTVSGVRISVHGHTAGQPDWTHAVDTSLWYLHAVHSRWHSAQRALHARLPPTACLHFTES